MGQKLNEIPAKKLAGLTGDLMKKLRDEVIYYEELDNFLNMPTEERRRQFCIKQRVEKYFELRQQGIIIPELSEKFIPKEKFTRSSKISYCFSDVTQDIINTTKPFDFCPGAELDSAILKFGQDQMMDDVDIMFTIGIRGNTGLLSVQEILYRSNYLMEQQADFKEGALLTNGWATTIGFFKFKDELHSAYVYTSDRRVWTFDALNYVMAPYQERPGGTRGNNAVLAPSGILVF